MPQSRNSDLGDLLEAICTPYSPAQLCNEETAALDAALRDGFGEGEYNAGIPASEFTSLEPGVLNPKFYYLHDYTDIDQLADEFWDDSHPEGKPAPFKEWPFPFDQKRLRIFFEFQKKRHTEWLLSEHALRTEDLGEDVEWYIRELLSANLFQKPWYEDWACTLFDWIDDARARCSKQEFVPLGFILATSLAGKLGRLVEQYRWKFLFEPHAKRGLKLQEFASLGGHLRSQSFKSKQEHWQRQASEIWSRKPHLSKSDVARQICKLNKLEVTPKHVSRYIKRP